MKFLNPIILGNTGLKVEDTNASHVLSIAPGTNLTANRTLTITTSDADRTLILSADTQLAGGTHSGTNTGDQTSVTGNAGTATALQNARTIGGVSFDGTANITVASATGGFTVSGGNLALGANSITMSGSLGVTGTRITKGWFTDGEFTNLPTVGGSTLKSALVLVKGDVGLGNVDNTSDATKNSASATLTNKIIDVSTALGTDDTYQGTVLSGRNAGATIAQWDAVYLGGSSTWLLADANGSSTYPARGLAVAAYSSGNAALILVHGTVRNDAWAWTPGGTIYLSTTAGGLTQTAPSASGDKIQAVGFAITADIAFFDFNSVYLTKS